MLEARDDNPPSVSEDALCLSSLKHYRSLMPMAMEARVPMLSLRPAHGAIGSHANAVKACFSDFAHLADNISVACKVEAV
ncbi:MAG: hypothetical protein R6V85_06340 [Polyangia bacterium]